MPAGGGFSKEQLAWAKQLQESYCSSGTSRSTGASSSHPTTSRPGHAAQPAHTTPTMQTSRMVSVKQVNRATSGLVRPLTAKGAYSDTFLSDVLQFPCYHLLVAGTIIAPVAESILIVVTGFIDTSLQNLPGTGGGMPRTTAPAGPPRTNVPSGSVGPPGSSRPFAPGTAVSADSSRPSGAPASADHSGPTASYGHYGPSGSSGPSVPTRAPGPYGYPGPGAPPVQLSTVLSAPSVMNPNPFTNTMQTSHKVEPLSSASTAENRVHSASGGVKAPAVVREALALSQMGNAIKWNWMSEAPVVRELNPEELRELHEPTPLPKGSDERIPWIRPFQDQLMKVERLAGGAASANECVL